MRIFNPFHTSYSCFADHLSSWKEHLSRIAKSQKIDVRVSCLVFESYLSLFYKAKGNKRLEDVLLSQKKKPTTEIIMFNFVIEVLVIEVFVVHFKIVVVKQKMRLQSLNIYKYSITKIHIYATNLLVKYDNKKIYSIFREWRFGWIFLNAQWFGLIFFSSHGLLLFILWIKIVSSWKSILG